MAQPGEFLHQITPVRERCMDLHTPVNTHSGDVRYNVCCLHSLPRLLAPAVTCVWLLNRLTG